MPDLLPADERARSLLRIQHAANLQLPISPNHRVRINGKIHCQLPDGWQLIPRLEQSSRDPARYLVNDLPVDRHSATRIQTELKTGNHLVIQCTSFIEQSREIFGSLLTA